MNAPIALFAYKRLDHLKKTVDALRFNHLADESILYLFSDAAKSDLDAPSVMSVREYIKTIKGFNKIILIEQAENLGLSRSIISGVTLLCKEHGRVIVLEDDIVTSKYFLKYMNDALKMYKNDEKVMSIHGYKFPFDYELSETYFLKGANSWGWATWDNKWRYFEQDGLKLLQTIKSKNLTHEFNLDGTCDYTNMLRDQVLGKNDSWAIRWRASVFLNDGLTLFPVVSHALNIGHDLSGVHCGITDVYDVVLATGETCVERIEVIEDKRALEALKIYYKKMKPPFSTRLIRKLMKYVKR